MRGGTTQPVWSEDLRAQVAMLRPTGPHTEADDHSVDGIVEGRSKRGIVIGGMAGSALTSTMLRKAPHRTVRCLMLEAVAGKTGPTEFQGGRWNRGLWWNCEPARNRKSGADKPPPKDARASGLPDSHLHASYG